MGAAHSISSHAAEKDWKAGCTMIWLCYILRCADGTLYTGITNDLCKRIAAHNAGTASKYTRVRCPVELVFEEICASRSAALKREMAIKGLSRAKKLALVKASNK